MASDKNHRPCLLMKPQEKIFTRYSITILNKTKQKSLAFWGDFLLEVWNREVCSFEGLQIR